MAEHFSVPLFAAKSDKEKCFQVTPKEKKSIIKYAEEAYENAKRRVCVFDDCKSSKIG